MTLAPKQKQAYQEQIRKALDVTFKRNLDTPQDQFTLDVNAERYIILSDQHRGARNRADDFRVAERAYNAALAYYYRRGHTLVVLGDVEELWEETPAAVVKAYDYTLSLEAKFHQAGRYLRFWGNHDNDWNDPATVEKYLTPVFGTAPRVRESALVRLVDNGEELGWVFLVHGHQGTSASDRWSPLSRLVVRYFWRQIQRISGKSLNTPAHNWELRDQHNIALYSWAAKQKKIVLIAGHTHRPVFESRSHPTQLREALTNVETQLQQNPQDNDLLEKLSLLAAELEWVRAQELDESGAEGSGAPIMSKPCYFNTGCCSFADGDITGLEIANGEIRLVRLPNYEDRPIPQILARASLRQVLARC